MWSTVEHRLALLELLVLGRLRRRSAQGEAFDVLSEVPWTIASGRRDELSLVEGRRGDLVALIDRVWVDWRDVIAELVARGLAPTPDGWTHLQDQLRAEGLGELPRLLNRHTAAALTAPHSKATLTERRLAALGDVDVTHDGTIRLRAPAGVSAALGDSRVDLSRLTEVLGEVAIPERAFLKGLRIEGEVRAVLLVENLGAWRDLPTLPGWLFGYVPGWDTTAVIHFLDRVASVPVAHFGDLDPNGVRIYQYLKERRPDLLWAVPEFWAEHVTTRGLKTRWPSDLNLRGCPALVLDLAQRGLWLEQECIAVDPRLSPWLEALASDASGK